MTHLTLSIPALLVALGASAQEPARPPADLVVTGRVFTADPHRPRANAVAIRGQRIVAVGELAALERQIGPETRILRTEGSVLPGFNDAHCHFTVAFGLGGDLDLTKAESLDEILELLRTFARENPEADPIQGRGWDLADMPDHEFPTAALLDEIVPDRPVLLWSDGPHGAWVNTAAMERAGIDADTPEPPSAIFLRDGTGAPTGVFLGRIFGLFRFLPFPDFEELRAGIRRGMDEANRLGVTSVHEPVSPLLLSYLAGLHDAGELSVRFHVWGTRVRGPFGGGPDQHEQLAELHGREHWITFGTLKGGVDGMPGLRTAALIEPYADDPTTRGFLSVGAAELEASLDDLNGRGLRVALHATGDAGVRLALSAFTKSHARYGLRNRIEHAFLVAPDDVARLAAADVVVSVQPAFLSLDLAKDRFYEHRFGPERCATVLPLRSLLDAGVVLAFGTDFNLTPLDPRIGLYAAVSRQTLDSEPADGWHPEERISLEEAISAYTRGSAMAEGADAFKGTLSVGKLADLVLLSDDVFALAPRELLEVEVEATIVGGTVVYERPR